LRRFNVGGAADATSLEVAGPQGSTVVATLASDPAKVTAAANSVGAFPFIDGAADSALLLDMPAGSATVTVRSSDDPKSTGRTIIIEAYEVP
jgi:hypothetical protein